MNIAIDVSQMCYLGTGVARYVHELTRALLLLHSPHHFVLYAGALRQRRYFTALKSQPPWNQATWKIFPLPPKLSGYAWSDTAIPFELLTGPVDLVHASDWSHPSTRAPLVTTVHDLVFRQYPDTVDPLIRSMQIKRLAKIASSHCHVIADSYSTQQDLLNYYALDPTRVTVVYPGVSESYQPASQSELDRVKRKYKLPDQFILSLGTQEPRKNLARLAQAARDTKLPLILVGQHGWGDTTQTLGYVPDTDLPALYSASTVFAYPSLYEGFGFPILEAMRCGTAVVTSNTSSLPELAGDAAVLVDPSQVEDITRGLNQAVKTRESLIHKGFLQAQKFTWQQTAQQVMQVYERLYSRYHKS